MALSLEQAIARVPQWQNAHDLQTTFLSGGITNLNYRIDVNDESFVLRIGGEDSELLCINRAFEHLANVAAAGLGIAPEVVYVIAPEGYLVTRFIAGQPIAEADMRRTENITRVAETLRQYHALPAIEWSFSPFRTVETYADTARRCAVSFPDNFDWLMARTYEIEETFRRDPFVPHFCHNDLLNANFLDDGRIRILDWEYAGMGDVTFDLSNFAVHHGFSDDDDRVLLQAYYGEAHARRLARHRLMKIVSDFREAMWAMVQIGISKLDFDFRGYANKHFNRMAESFNDPRCAQWLAEV